MTTRRSVVALDNGWREIGVDPRGLLLLENPDTTEFATFAFGERMGGLSLDDARRIAAEALGMEVPSEGHPAVVRGHDACLNVGSIGRAAYPTDNAVGGVADRGVSRRDTGNDDVGRHA